MKKLFLISVFLLIAVVSFGQMVSSPKVAEKLFSANKTTAEQVLKDNGFTNIKTERKAVQISETQTKDMTVVSGQHVSYSTTCEVFYDDSKTTPGVISLKYVFYTDAQKMMTEYQSYGYQLTGTQDLARPNPTTDRLMFIWGKTLKDGSTVGCYSDIRVNVAWGQQAIEFVDFYKK